MILRLSEMDNEMFISGVADITRFISEKEKTFSVLEPPAFRLNVEKRGQGVEITGTVEGVVQMTCVRCLEKSSVPVRTDVHVELLPMTVMSGATEIELKAQDMEVDYFNGEEIDIDQIVWEEILLNIPIQFLCGEQCKGICEVCGKNRNYEECSCEKNVSTLLGEKLRAFLN